MNPEPEYPYPNWKGRPTGDPTEVIKALRQCRKARTNTCTMPFEIRAWAGHFHWLNKRKYQNLLRRRLEELYGSLPDVQRSDLAMPGRDNATILWDALMNEAHATGGIPFFEIARISSETMVPEREEAIESGGWLSRKELAAEHARLRRALDMLTTGLSALRGAFDAAVEVLNDTE